MSVPKDSRHLARSVVLQILFVNYFDNAKINANLANFASYTDIVETNDYNKKLAQKLLTGVVSNLEKIDSIIAERAKKHSISEMNKVDLHILRIAVYEGIIAELNPIGIVINEAIELAKEFGGEHSREFVNAVLDKILKDEDGNK